MPLFAKKSEADFIPQQEGGLLKNKTISVLNLNMFNQNKYAKLFDELALFAFKVINTPMAVNSGH